MEPLLKRSLYFLLVKSLCTRVFRFFFFSKLQLSFDSVRHRANGAQCPGRRWKSNKRCCRIHHISQLLPEGPLVTATKTHFHADSALDRWIKDIKWNLNVENCIWDYERLYEIAANLLPAAFKKKNLRENFGQLFSLYDSNSRVKQMW